ncbi:MAG: hypothetical protein R3F33_06125 [Planctomycetota bacterium]
MKLLSDFDGVWTNQAGEAKAARGAFVRRMAELLGQEPETVDRRFQAWLDECLADPAANGWAPDGRITAFVDEDPLLHTAAVAHRIDLGASTEAVEAWRQAARDAGFESVAALSSENFVESTKTYRESGGALLLPNALEIVAELHAMEVEIVVVSNSAPEKLEQLFHRADIRVGEDLRVVGNAGKFVLGPEDRTWNLAGRTIQLDRPKYEAVLLEELPDFVIGDVFSLDLALPTRLRNSGRLSPALRTLLRAHDHTSDWILENQEEAGLHAVLSNLAELPDHLI